MRLLGFLWRGLIMVALAGHMLANHCHGANPEGE